MKIHSVAVVALLALVWGGNANAYCTDLRHPSVKADIAEHEVIIIGEVESATALREDKSNPKTITRTIYATKVVEFLKGAGPKVINISAENIKTAFPMIIGKQYLLFLTPSQDDFYIDSCGNSDVMSTRKQVLKEVRKIVGVHSKK